MCFDVVVVSRETRTTAECPRLFPRYTIHARIELIYVKELLISWSRLNVPLLQHLLSCFFNLQGFDLFFVCEDTPALTKYPRLHLV